MEKRKLWLTVAALAVMFLLPAVAKADPIILVIDPGPVIPSGSSAMFTGSLSNTGAPGRFINSVSMTSSNPGITFDDSPFFTTVPPFLAAGASAAGNFFEVFVSLAVAPGIYSGSFTVLGGDDANADNELATQEFTITVGPRGQGGAVPEPTTMVLLGTGLAGMAAAARKKRKLRREGST